MTLIFPPHNWLDRLLAYFGRVRYGVIPRHIDKLIDRYGPDLILKVRRECFFKALFRRRKEH